MEYGREWDTGVPLETNFAIIPASFTVNYNLPMVATSFASLTNHGILNINTNGFVVNTNGNAAIHVSVSAQVFVNTNGVLTATAGGMTLTTNSFCTLYPGGAITLAGTMLVGSGGNSIPGVEMAFSPITAGISRWAG